MYTQERMNKKRIEYMQEIASDTEIVPTLYSWMIPIENRKYIDKNQNTDSKNDLYDGKAKDADFGLKNMGLK